MEKILDLDISFVALAVIKNFHKQSQMQATIWEFWSHLNLKQLMMHHFIAEEELVKSQQVDIETVIMLMKNEWMKRLEASDLQDKLLRFCSFTQLYI